MVQDDQPPSPLTDDLADEKFFIPGRMRYPTPLRPRPPYHSPNCAADVPPIALAVKPVEVREPRQELPLHHGVGEVDDDMAAMLQMAAVTMAVDAVAGSASADTANMSGTPGVVAVEIDDDGRAAVFVDVLVTNVETGTKKTLTVKVEREEGGGLPVTVVTDIVASLIVTRSRSRSVTETEGEDAVQMTVDFEPEALETARVLLPDEEPTGENQIQQGASEEPYPVTLACPGPFLPTSNVSPINTRPNAARGLRNTRFPAFDGAQDIANDRDLEAQRNNRRSNNNTVESSKKNRVVTSLAGPPRAQNLLHGLVRTTYIARMVLVLTLFVQIPITLAVFAVWALIPKQLPKGTITTFGLEFAFLTVSSMGFVLVLIGRAIPRLGGRGVAGYRALLRRRGRRRGGGLEGKGKGKMRTRHHSGVGVGVGVGFWADVLAEAVVAGGFAVVLGLKVAVLGSGRGVCLSGDLELVGVGGGKAAALAEWGWGSVNCERLVAVIVLLGWEVAYWTLSIVMRLWELYLGLLLKSEDRRYDDDAGQEEEEEEEEEGGS